MITIAWQLDSKEVKDIKYFDIRFIAVNEKGNLHEMPEWECMGSRDPLRQINNIVHWVKTTSNKLGNVQLVPDEEFPEFSNEIIAKAKEPVVNLRNLSAAANIDLQKIDVDEIVDLEWNKYIIHIKKALTNARLAMWLKARIAGKTMHF